MSRVRALRLENGWSLDELCRRTNVSKSNLWSIETQGRSPTVDIARKIASAFGESIEEVFPEEKTAVV